MKHLILPTTVQNTDIKLSPVLINPRGKEPEELSTEKYHEIMSNVWSGTSNQTITFKYNSQILARSVSKEHRDQDTRKFIRHILRPKNC